MNKLYVGFTKDVRPPKTGLFNALVLGLFLMAHFKGQVVVPDFGFYGREGHVSLIRENRLIAGVNSLAELSPKLRQAVLLIKDKEAAGATYEDAETLARYAGFPLDLGDDPNSPKLMEDIPILVRNPRSRLAQR
jgi:hypothetical protein